MSAMITRSKRVYGSDQAETPEGSSIGARETSKRKRVIHSKAPPPPTNDGPSLSKLRSSSDSKDKVTHRSNLDLDDVSKPDKPLPTNLKIVANTSGRWLMKSEPDAFSLDDLYAQNEPAEWDGVRNHEAKVSTETRTNHDVNLFSYGLFVAR